MVLDSAVLEGLRRSEVLQPPSAAHVRSHCEGVVYVELNDEAVIPQLRVVLITICPLGSLGRDGTYAVYRRTYYVDLPGSFQYLGTQEDARARVFIKETPKSMLPQNLCR